MLGKVLVVLALSGAAASCAAPTAGTATSDTRIDLTGARFGDTATVTITVTVTPTSGAEQKADAKADTALEVPVAR